ncbi:MAG: ketoacyl-ACP synthase III [Bacteroidales bacterium]|nr:ketoacyl-ACP synthase III [Bacteroidales bacterium]
MGFQHYKNVEIRGLAACVPKNIEDNRQSQLFSTDDQKKMFIETTGVISRHVIANRDICSSDLCFEAANKLMYELNWKREEIDCLIFVSQTPDYIMPATACILQERLGLSNECFAMDISLGCSGWIYGVSTVAALLQTGYFKKGLLLAGDTSTVTKSKKDKSTYPLFGDCGTATALQYKKGCVGFKAHTATDGKGYKAIYIPHGGFRTFYNSWSGKEIEFPDGNIRTNLHTILDGPTVFTFGISKVPLSISGLLKHFNIDIELIDYFIFHQANKILNEQIRKKLKLPVEKVPYSIEYYGNTSSASIPLTMVTKLKNKLESGNCRLIACGFGVGLSWGTIYFETNNIICPEIIEI